MSAASVARRNTQLRQGRLVQADLEQVFGGPVNLAPLRMSERSCLFHGKFAEHLWCTCCKRTFPNGSFRQVGEIRLCPYAGCSGHASVDAMPWERIKVSHPEYPEVPVLGMRYTLAAGAAPVRSQMRL